MIRKLFSQFTIWVVIVALLITAAMIVFTLFSLWYFTPDGEVSEMATPLVTVILAPTRTPSPEPTIMGIEAEADEQLLGLDGIHIGSAVQIFNTENAGLRLRSEPGIGGSVQFVGDELEIFEVSDGPETNDGYIWWYLESPYDTSRSGWAAADYLQIIE